MIDIEELLFKIKHEQGGVTLFDVSTIIKALEQQQARIEELKKDKTDLLEQIQDENFVKRNIILTTQKEQLKRVRR